MKMTLRGKENRAFTLVELQTAAAASFLILAAAVSLYILYWRGFAAGDSVLDVYSNSRIAMGWLSKDIRWGAQILPSSTITTGYTTSDNCTVLQVPSIANNSGVISIIPAQYDEIIYRVQNGTMYQTVSPYTAGSSPSARAAGTKTIARYCNPVTFYKVDTSNGTWTSLSNFINAGGNLSTVNNLGISLPVNDTTLSLSGTVVKTNTLTPTVVVRLRNK
jgi:Tfp pilus assembly protein PilW